MADRTTEETAVCRGCGRALRGKPYRFGGDAYVPGTELRAKANHYGGFVCSEVCDRRAHLALEETMPGHAGQTRLSPHHSDMISRKWAP